MNSYAATVSKDGVTFETLIGAKSIAKARAKLEREGFRVISIQILP